MAINVQAIDINSDRIAGILITLADKSTSMVLNVYLPTDLRSMTHVSQEYEMCIDMLEMCINRCAYDKLVIGGDFNTDFSRKNAHSEYLNHFLERNSLVSVWHMTGAQRQDDVYTYKTYDGHRSCIDHFMISATLQGFVKSVSVLECDVYTKKDVEEGQRGKCKIAWHKISNYDEYVNIMNHIISYSTDIYDLPSLQCSDRNCQDRTHRLEIDQVCTLLTDMCISAADLALPKVAKRNAIPGWNADILPLKRTAEFWGNIWRENGRPSTGIVCDIFRKCRREYHYAIRAKKSNDDSLRKERLAESVAANNSRDMWREIRKISSSRKTSPPHIDGVTDRADIAQHFGNKYNSLYNSIPVDLSGIYMKVNKSVLSDPLDDYTLCLDVVNKAVSKLKTEKQDGDKGLWSNLVINAPISWKNMLKALIESMIIHDHYAQELLLSTLSSLPKNNFGDLCDSDNYRGIALTSCLNKVIDWVILLKYRDQLHTSHMQFAYKENHSTSMCTMALKEVVKYYSLRRGQVYCCLLDASKAFDKVRFDKLFQMLLQRNLPACILRLLLDMYFGWICIFGFGCFVGDEYFGSMCYADDITLLAPTFASLKSMIKICEKFGKEFDLTFNASKTVCIYFPGKRRYRENPPTLYMSDKALSWVKSVKHLANIVTWDLREVEEISKKRCDFIGRTNSLLANFKSIQKEILSRVFLSQCCHMYGSQAWALDACHIKNFCSTWRKAIRKLWGLPNIARSVLVPHLVNAPPIEDQLFQRTAKMYNGIRKGHNPKLLLLLQLSTNADKMGIMGNNTRIISNRWLCGFNRLERNFVDNQSQEIATRVSLIKDLTTCEIPGLTSDEIVEMKNFIACY